MKKFQVVSKFGYDEFICLETDDIEEAKSAARKELATFTQREIKNGSAVEIRTDIETDECDTMSWNTVEF